MAVITLTGPNSNANVLHLLPVTQDNLRKRHEQCKMDLQYFRSTTLPSSNIPPFSLTQ